MVVAPSFDGVALLDRHRAVQGVLEVEIAKIHAFQAPSRASSRPSTRLRGPRATRLTSVITA